MAVADLLEPGGGRAFSTPPSPLLLVVTVVVLDANCSLLALLEPLVLAVRPVPVLDHHGGVRHLLVVRVLLVATVVVLDDYCGGPLFVLLLLLAALVRTVSLLDDLGRFVQFPLFTI